MSCHIFRHSPKRSDQVRPQTAMFHLDSPRYYHAVVTPLHPSCSPLQRHSIDLGRGWDANRIQARDEPASMYQIPGGTELRQACRILCVHVKNSFR